MRVSVARHDHQVQCSLAPQKGTPDEEYGLIPKDTSPGTRRCRPRHVYKISFSQFEELTIAAQTAEGKLCGQGYQHARSGLSQR